MRILIYFALTLSMCACGGSGGGDGGTAPVGVINDANGNGVREEVDQFIASEQLPTAAVPAATALASTYQAWLGAPDPSGEAEARASLTKALQRVACLVGPLTSAQAAALDEKINAKTFDTAERRAKLMKLYDAAGTYVLPEVGCA